jgi:hypothetical protein
MLYCLRRKTDGRNAQRMGTPQHMRILMSMVTPIRIAEWLSRVMSSRLAARAAASSSPRSSSCRRRSRLAVQDG